MYLSRDREREREREREGKGEGEGEGEGERERGWEHSIDKTIVFLNLQLTSQPTKSSVMKVDKRMHKGIMIYHITLVLSSNRSVVSENTSRAQTPALPQDDESVISSFNEGN